MKISVSNMNNFFLLKHDHPWGLTFVDFMVTTHIRIYNKILYLLCLLAKPLLITSKWKNNLRILTQNKLK